MGSSGKYCHQLIVLEDKLSGRLFLPHRPRVGSNVSVDGIRPMTKMCRQKLKNV